MALDTLVTSSKLAAIANAIRTKGGTQAQLTLDQMPQAVADLPSGGGANGIAAQTLYRGYSTTPDSYVDIAAADFGDEGTNKVIRAHAFSPYSDSYTNAQRLRRVEIPAWVTLIDTRAFEYSSVQQIAATGSDILTLGERAFANSKLGSFAPSRVIELPAYGYQFVQCTSLVSVDIEIRAQSGTTYVPGRCFAGCSALKSLKLRSTSSSITFAVYALSNLTSLEEMVLDFGVVPSLTNNALYNLPSNCSIYVRDALVEDYKTETNWSAFASQIKKLSEYVAQ